MSVQTLPGEPPAQIAIGKRSTISADDGLQPSSVCHSSQANSHIDTAEASTNSISGDHPFRFNSDRLTDHLKVTVLPDGRKQVNQYILLKTLGKGSFGKVKLALDADSKTHYAIKIVDKALMKRKRVLGRTSVTDQLSNLRREVELMKLIDHVNVVQLHEIIDDPNNDKFYIVLEHIMNGPVIDLRDEDCIPLPEDVCKSYLRDVLSGLEYLHSLKIAHRDIKPDNLLLSQDGIVKIADFGVSMQFLDSNDYIRATAGSLAFMAPEMCLSYSAKKTDVWSTGISLYAMLFGKVPFTANSAAELYDTISRAKLEWPRPISPPLETLLRGMLEKDPLKRMTLAQLKEDPWLTDSGAHPFGAEESKQRSPRLHASIPETNQSDQQSIPITSNTSSAPITATATTANSVGIVHPNGVEQTPSVLQSALRPIRHLYSRLTTSIENFLSRLRQRSSAVQPEDKK